MDSNEIISKSELIHKYQKFFNSWECSEYTVLRCLQELGGKLLENNLIDKQNLLLIDMWVEDLKSIGYEDSPVVPESLTLHEPCIGKDSLSGVYFHPSIRQNENPLQSR